VTWWLRLGVFDHARQARAAFAAVERYGLDKASDETKRLYNDLILEITGHGHGG
jgi:hypothetical protein